ncbi:MAG: LysM peptidoglycan-binding domain-containing protein [Chloroflexi bacterium]|nr:LysM peptidoglycan-binding domain-containing protein [Chloroflexota bacterium]
MNYKLRITLFDFSRVLFFALVAALAACAAPESSALDAPLATIARENSATPTRAPATPIPLPQTLIERYDVRAGDTLGNIAARYNIALEELMELNGIVDANTLKIGQQLKVPIQVTRAAPSEAFIPDSEIVYGPAYENFDIAAFANSFNGYLAAYRQNVEGETMSGAQILQLVAERYSVGPRVLLALVEMQSGWVTNSIVTNIQYPLGLADSTRQGLFFQASWAANHLNEGYYGKLAGRLSNLRLKDRTRVFIPTSLNAGTVAVMNVLAQINAFDQWQNQIGADGFRATYRKLFGELNPAALETIPARDLKQPALRLPWSDGEMWYFSGGPHTAWGDNGAWAAIDISPNDIAGSGSCAISRRYALAAASGKIARSERGRVVIALNGNNFQGKGWALLYLHIARDGRIGEGVQVQVGEKIGHPSCEGGSADASHLHFARLYNGQWIEPTSAPFILSGWSVQLGDQEYAGTIARGAETREACNCRDDFKNGIVADAGK